jgi:hypothetical protein
VPGQAFRQPDIGGVERDAEHQGAGEPEERFRADETARGRDRQAERDEGEGARAQQDDRRVHDEAERDDARVDEGPAPRGRRVEHEQHGGQDEGRREDVRHQEAAERAGRGDQCQARERGHDRPGPAHAPDQVEDHHGQPRHKGGLQDDDAPDTRPDREAVEQHRVDRRASTRDRRQATGSCLGRDRLAAAGAPGPPGHQSACDLSRDAADNALADAEVVLAVGEQERVPVPDRRKQQQDRPDDGQHRDI